MLERVREKTDGEEIEYGFVVDCLSDHKNPRVAIQRWLKRGDLIRIKKGIYVFGPKWARNPYSSEILSNKIYGPSYISLEYALAYYRLIPEHVEVITAVTSKRSKSFSTPVGQFQYRHIPAKLFAHGAQLIQVRKSETALMATPEKALVDLLVLRRERKHTLRSLEALLLEDLRLDETEVLKFSKDQLDSLQRAFPHPIIPLLLKLIDYWT